MATEKYQCAHPLPTHPLRLSPVGIVVALNVLTLLLTQPVHGYFTESHACGDSQTRFHLLKMCRRSLQALDASHPPPLSEALDDHNSIHYHNAHRGEELKNAREVAHQCLLCVLHGLHHCDLPIHEQEHDPFTFDEEDHIDNTISDLLSSDDESTDLSQNCKDHIKYKKDSMRGQPFPFVRKSAVHVDGTHTLYYGTNDVITEEEMLHPLDTVSLAETAAPKVSGTQPVVDNTAVSEEEATDGTLEGTDAASNLNKLAAEQDSAKRDQTTPTSEAGEGESNKRELSESAKPYYLCAIVDHRRETNLVCPSGKRITKILYSSFGTPLRKKQSNTVEDRQKEENEKQQEEDISEPVKGRTATTTTTTSDAPLEPLLLAEMGITGMPTVVGRGGVSLHAHASTPVAAATPSTKGTTGGTVEATSNTSTIISKPGVLMFTGDTCFDANFQTRAECTAYNSVEIVTSACKDATQCTLRATGDPKVFPFTFQKLTCDKTLKLFVKVQCEDVKKVKTAGGAANGQEAATQLLESDSTIGKAEVALLDFNDPYLMEFSPGLAPIQFAETTVEPGEEYKSTDGTWKRPDVREQIEPPADDKVVGYLQGYGFNSFKCEDSGKKDEDGNIYIWRPNGAEPLQTYMTLYNVSDPSIAVGRWSLATNKYSAEDEDDRSFAIPEESPIGEISDTMAVGSKKFVQNAPDFLYRIAERSEETGLFSNVDYIQRYGTTDGVPPSSDGVVVMDGKTWNKCSGNQVNDEPKLEKVTGMYVLYSQKERTAQEGNQSTPVWLWLVISFCVLFILAVIACVVYWKVKGAPRWLTRKRAKAAFTKQEAEAFNSALLYDDDDTLDDGVEMKDLDEQL